MFCLISNIHHFTKSSLIQGKHHTDIIQMSSRFIIMVALKVNKIVMQAEFPKSINFRNIQMQDL